MTIRPQMLAFLIAASGTVLAADTPKEIPADKFEISKVEKEVLDLTNAERAKESLPPFKPHPLLFQAAREHLQRALGYLGRPYPSGRWKTRAMATSSFPGRTASTGIATTFGRRAATIVTSPFIPGMSRRS